MPKELSIANKILSLHGQMLINGSNDEQRYSAKGEFALYCPTWTINNGEKNVATIKRKSWSITPIWNVSSDFGEFFIKRKLFSWKRNYYIFNGPYDGAVVEGSFWRSSLEIAHNGKRIAAADSKLFSVRDKHLITVHDDDKNSELLTTIVMVTLLLDRKSDSENSDHSNSDNE